MDGPVVGRPELQGPLGDFVELFSSWCDAHADELRTLWAPCRNYDDRVEQARNHQRILFGAGWARCGWPEEAGGFGGSILHRAVIAEELCRRGWRGPGLFEHIEVIAPTLCAHASPSLLARELPSLLSGEWAWSQGFSEPDAGSDLASLRTRGVAVDGHLSVTGRKIWTSWAKYADRCLALVRTGTPESRHRGLTMVVLDLGHPGVEVTPIRQANGTDELAEVTLDAVPVAPDAIVGDVGAGWDVALHLLAHERGTLSWFRHCQLLERLNATLPAATSDHDRALGDLVVDLAALRATASNALAREVADVTRADVAAYNKLMMTKVEQHLHEYVRVNLGAKLVLGQGADDPELLLAQEDFLFSGITSVYGGSEQMQLTIIANRLLGLPQ